MFKIVTIKNSSMIKKTALLILALAVVVAGFGPIVVGSTQKAYAAQTPENDDPFDVTDYYGFSEDTLVTRALGEFFPPFDFDFKFQFNISGNNGPFGGGRNVDTNTNMNLTPNFTPEEQFQKKSSEIDTPKADIQLASPNVEPGGTVMLAAQPQGFESETGPQDLFYGWALGNVSLAGVAAGADPLDLPQSAGIKDIHSRTPEVDQDQDGMDDNWELRYGLDPANPADAAEDPDQDGFVNDFYHNQLGELLRVQPPTTVGEPGEKLTNLEEYIWGTDPTNPDTDGDGFKDGADLAGLGQQNVNIVIPSTAAKGDKFIVRLTVLGNSFQKFDRDTNLVKLDSQVKELIIADNEQVAARLSIDNEHPVPGDTVTLEAHLGQTDYHEGLLTYQWLVNNVPQEDASGESNFTFTYQIPRETLPDSTLTFAVKAQNFATEQEARASLDVLVSDLVQINYDPKKVIPGKTFTIKAALLDNTPPQDLIFHWAINGQEELEKSGRGQTALTIPVNESAGGDFNLSLRVTKPDNSEQIGEVKAVIQVQKPQVDIITPTSYPSPGQVVQLVAVPEFFKSEQLTYEWLVDGKSQGPPKKDNSTFEVKAGRVNEITRVDVKVATLGARSDTAVGTEYLTALLPSPTAHNEGTPAGSSGDFKSFGLARLLPGPAAVLGYWILAGVALIVIFGIIFISIKKHGKKLPKKKRNL